MSADFSDPEEFFRMMDFAMSGGAPDWDAIEAKYSRLVKEIVAFDLCFSCGVVAGLLTFPQFHANTMRLEVLQHLLQRNATGSNRPTRNTLSKWLNKILGEGFVAMMEDPPEDVFVSNVVNNFGNNRVFEGIWAANDFWLQEALNGLNRFTTRREVDLLLIECSALLRLSEMLAQRCSLERNAMGEIPRHQDVLPTMLSVALMRSTIRVGFAL